MKILNKIISITLIFSPVLLYLLVRLYAPELMVFDNLLATFENLYQNYGFYIILIAGIVESIFVLNMFVPGSLVILFGAVLAGKGVISLPMVITAGTVGLLFGYTLNYFIGCFGYYSLFKDTAAYKAVEPVKKKLKNQQGFITFLSGFNPGAAAIVSLTSGILKLNFGRFISLFLIVQLFWSTFWGVLFYAFGVKMLENVIYVFLAAVFLIAISYFVKNKFFFQNQ